LRGVSISGGEPFEQAEALLDLLLRVRQLNLSTLIFTGYSLERATGLRLASAIFGLTDVVVAGPYVQSQHLGCGLLGSANQRLHLLTGRCCPSDFAGLPAAEVILHRDGSATLSGVSPLRGLRGLSQIQPVGNLRNLRNLWVGFFKTAQREGRNGCRRWPPGR
jgi:anaerobic ribonucleoside-triphosphate reductase activating protein